RPEGDHDQVDVAAVAVVTVRERTVYRHGPHVRRVAPARRLGDVVGERPTRIGAVHRAIVGHRTDRCPPTTGRKSRRGPAAPATAAYQTEAVRSSTVRASRSADGASVTGDGRVYAGSAGGGAVPPTDRRTTRASRRARWAASAWVPSGSVAASRCAPSVPYA